MTFERVLVGGLVLSVGWMLAVLWWLTRRPKVRRPGYVGDRWKRS